MKTPESMTDYLKLTDAQKMGLHLGLHPLVIHLIYGDIDEMPLDILGGECPTQDEYQRLDTEQATRLQAAATVQAWLNGRLHRMLRRNEKPDRRPIKPRAKPSKKRRPLSTERLTNIVDRLPGGLRGFRTYWGWLIFARAIERAHGIKGKIV
jgi:hypothetical protein